MFLDLSCSHFRFGFWKFAGKRPPPHPVEAAYKLEYMALPLFPEFPDTPYSPLSFKSFIKVRPFMNFSSDIFHATDTAGNVPNRLFGPKLELPSLLTTNCAMYLLSYV